MKRELLVPFLMLAALFQAARAGSDDELVQILEKKSQVLVEQAVARVGDDGPEVFRYFVDLVAGELSTAGDEEMARQLQNTLNGQNGNAIPVKAFAWILHTYAREFYRDDIIAATTRLIQFKTFATEVPNRENPEFIRQKTYLQELSKKLGLQFRDVDGYVQEIWIGEGLSSFGLMVHSDVQPVDTTAWNSDPWSGAVRDGVLWGRGAMDDKGPLAVIMYGMRALLDSGLPLKKKLILLVGTDEESANEDVKTYLKTNQPPDQTIVVDSGFPVICAEKGWCGLWLKLARQPFLPPERGFMVTELQGGFSPSIVPGKATAMLKPLGLSPSDAEARLRSLARDFAAKRENARLDIQRVDSAVVVTAHGRPVHSSVPETGHNALMDLLVWLDQVVKPVENDIAVMAKFASIYIGLDLDGRKLGIAHRDPFMGDVTVAGNLFQTTEDTVMFMLNFRLPRGIESETARDEIVSRMQKFASLYDIEFATQFYLSDALYNDPEGPFVKDLLRIYNEVTGENRQAKSIGGGTYAKRLPNAVVFGPNLPDDEYLGHQPNEHIKLTTLTRNIEILTHTLAEFGLKDALFE